MRALDAVCPVCLIRGSVPGTFTAGRSALLFRWSPDTFTTPTVIGFTWRGSLLETLTRLSCSLTLTVWDGTASDAAAMGFSIWANVTQKCQSRHRHRTDYRASLCVHCLVLSLWSIDLSTPGHPFIGGRWIVEFGRSACHRETSLLGAKGYPQNQRPGAIARIGVAGTALITIVTGCTGEEPVSAT